MDIRETDKGCIIRIKVKPNSHEFRLRPCKGKLVLEVKSPPREGKANMEIVKGLGKLFGKEIEILRGARQREKLILVREANKSDIMKSL